MEPNLPENFNPYAAPAELEAEDQAIADLMKMVRASEGLWRDGKFLIIRRGTVLPPVCVKTGIPATRSFVVIVRNRTWLQWMGLFLACLPGFFILGLLEESRAIRIYLCDDEHRKLRVETLQTVACFLLAIIIALTGIVFPILETPAVLMMVGCAAKLVVSCHPLRFHKFTSHYTAVSGAGEGFLQQLPEMPSMDKTITSDPDPAKP